MTRAETLYAADRIRARGRRKPPKSVAYPYGTRYACAYPYGYGLRGRARGEGASCVVREYS